MSKSILKDSIQDKVFNIVNHLWLAVFLAAVSYPFIYILSCSFSSGDALMAGRVVIFPVEPTLDGYKAVFAYDPIWTGYFNSFVYMITGTLISITITIMAAYPLSRDEVKGKIILMPYFLFTMIFSGGLVPSYMLIRQLHVYDSMWAIVLPGALSAYNVIVARTFFKQTIPKELLEASKMDGCTDFGFLFKIVIPLSKPIIAVLGLWMAVGIWNSYFSALIYLNTRSKFPLQLILRELLVLGNVDLTSSTMDPALLNKYKYMSEMLRYGSIVVSSLPLMILYPFVQKYFVKGVMIGSVKG